jgi:hypothetical protein
MARPLHPRKRHPKKATQAKTLPPAASDDRGYRIRQGQMSAGTCRKLVARQRQRVGATGFRGRSSRSVPLTLCFYGDGPVPRFASVGPPTSMKLGLWIFDLSHVSTHNCPSLVFGSTRIATFAARKRISDPRLEAAVSSRDQRRDQAAD